MNGNNFPLAVPGNTFRDQKKIFEKYYQVKQNESTSMGNGLGLYIVKQIVDLHKGNIKLISKEGEGSVFTILIPKGRRDYYD